MGRIQSSIGLITGVAIEDTVNQLMKLNALPKDRLESRNQVLQKEQVAVTELMTLVVGVQLTTDRLGQASLFSATKVDSSTPTSLTARSTGSPSPGSYSFVPVRRAQSQQLASSTFASADQKLSSGEVILHRGGFLDDTVSLDGLNGGQGVARGYIRITDRTGASQAIDLRFVQSAGDVVDAINSADGLNVVASLRGGAFHLTDVSGSTAHDLEVTEVSGGTTAADLGLGGLSAASSSATGSQIRALHDSMALRSLRDGIGLHMPSQGDALQVNLRDGSQFTVNGLDSATASVGQLIEHIETAGGGKVAVRVSSGADRLEIEDLTAGGGSFSVTSPSGDLAEQLGWDNAASGGTITGDRLISGLGDTLLSSLAGGQGLGPLGQIMITDRSGTAATIDLSAAATVQEVVDAINGAAVGVYAQLNRSKTGIEILDTSGSMANDLTVANADGTNSATALGIDRAVASNRLDSGSLRRQYIGRNTLLSDWKQGAGLTFGSIRFTDSAGNGSALSLATLAPKTVGEVIDAINELNIEVEARINETGDGILLVDKAGGSGTLTVSDVGSSTTAAQLGIAGTAAALTLSGNTASGIDGSQTIRISTTAEMSLTELVEEINELSGGPVRASLLNTSDGSGVRLLLNANQSGGLGRVAIESDAGISFSQTTRGQDALLAFGATEAGGGVLVSSRDNTFKGVLEDIELSIVTESRTPVTVTVAENKENLIKQVDTFVAQFNKLREKLDQVTVFDEASQSVGILFGKNSSLRVDMAFGRFFSGTFRGAGSIRSLAQLGIRLNETGKLEFNKTKFEAALAADPEAVQEFFTKESSGFSAKAKAVADSLAGVESGALLNQSNSLQSQIEQNSQRIDTLTTRLDKQRERLLKQFYGMETAIAKLQQNLTALNQLQVIPPLGST